MLKKKDRKSYQEHKNDRLNQQMMFTTMEREKPRCNAVAAFKSDFYKDYAKWYGDNAKGE